jgi:hypothetical protein
MAYITAWVNQGGRQASPVTSIEHDFRSGLRFVDLLCHEGALSPDDAARLLGKEGYASSAAAVHPLEVFDEVCGAMDRLGCSYKPSAVGKAARGERGGAAALLWAIKDGLERTARGPPAPPGPRAIDSVYEHGLPFERGQVTAFGAEDFLEVTYKAHPEAFLPGRNAFQPVDMAVHLRKFHDDQR